MQVWQLMANLQNMPAGAEVFLLHNRQQVDDPSQDETQCTNASADAIELFQDDPDTAWVQIRTDE